MRFTVYLFVSLKKRNVCSIGFCVVLMWFLPFCLLIPEHLMRQSDEMHLWLFTHGLRCVVVVVVVSVQCDKSIHHSHRGVVWCVCYDSHTPHLRWYRTVCTQLKLRRMSCLYKLISFSRTFASDTTATSCSKSLTLLSEHSRPHIFGR